MAARGIYDEQPVGLRDANELARAVRLWKPKGGDGAQERLPLAGGTHAAAEEPAGDAVTNRIMLLFPAKSTAGISIP